MTVSTAVLAYLLTNSCGIDSEIKGSQNKVDNKIQKGLVNVDLSSTGNETCNVWTELGLEMFEWMVISVMLILLTYWMAKKTFGKQGLIQQIKAKREQSRLDKIEKMKSVLRKQGIIINKDVTENEEEPNERKQAEPKVKFYGQETLAAV